MIIKNVKNYFDEKANNYQSNSIKFPWSLLRKKESLIITQMLGKIKNNEILDVGAGAGYYSRVMIKKEAKKVYAVDISKLMLKNLKLKKIVKINKDAEKFKIKKKFYKIICAGLLEFAFSAEKILINIRLHAYKNSKLVILFPMNNFLGRIYQLYHLKNGIKIKLFNDSEINMILKNSGWTVKKSKKKFFSNVILAKAL